MPQVVRVGADASINIAVKDISLDALVEQRLATQPEIQRQEKSERQSVLQEIQNLKQQKKTKQEQISATAGNSARVLQLEREIKEINGKRMALSARANELREQDTNAQRAFDTVRRKARIDILNEADVICCTLSGSGHEALDGHQFDMVIIDEAAQAVELSSLIPLKFQAERCVMVGGALIHACPNPFLSPPQILNNFLRQSYLLWPPIMATTRGSTVTVVDSTYSYQTCLASLFVCKEPDHKISISSGLPSMKYSARRSLNTSQYTVPYAPHNF